MTARESSKVRLMPPQYANPYVNRSKNDPPDAEAIRAVVTRPTMRFVGVKSPESQVASLIPRAMPAPDL